VWRFFFPWWNICVLYTLKNRCIKCSMTIDITTNAKISITDGHVTDDMNLLIFSIWSLCPSLVLIYTVIKKTHFWGQKYACRLSLLHVKHIVYLFASCYIEAYCYNIWSQLLHLQPIITLEASCYYIWSQLHVLHLRPIIIITLYYNCGLNNWPAGHVPTAFLVPPNFHSGFYNSVETQYMFSIWQLSLLEN